MILTALEKLQFQHFPLCSDARKKYYAHLKLLNIYKRNKIKIKLENDSLLKCNERSLF